jgi:hypothetical protein
VNPEPDGARTAAGPSELQARLGAVEDQLDGLVEAAFILTERLDHLDPATAANPAAAPAPAPAAAEAAAGAWAVRAWWWPALDPDATAVAWQRLEAWVSHALLARHPQHARVLLACWRVHPGVVDELTALRAAWHDAYTNPRAAPTAAADWLARRLPDTITRITAAFTMAGCRIEGGQVVHGDLDHRHHPGGWTEEQLTAAHIPTEPPRPAGDL